MSNPGSSQFHSMMPQHSNTTTDPLSQTSNIFIKNTMNSEPRAQSTVKTMDRFERWNNAIGKSPAVAPHIHVGKNILYEKGHNALIVKKEVLPHFIEKDNKTGVFKVFLKQKNIFGYAFKYENGYWYCLLTPENKEEKLVSDPKFLKPDGWTTVTKSDYEQAVKDLFNLRTTIKPGIFPEHMRRFVNFNGQKNEVPSVNPSDMLNEFKDVVLKWGFDMTPHQLELVFLRKIGFEHSVFVQENSSVFKTLAAKVRYDKHGADKDETLADQMANGHFDTHGFVKYKHDNYTLFITQNVKYYRGEKIDHVFIDGTGSLPAPYSQIVNVTYYDKEGQRHRYLCSFLLKDSGLHISTSLWEEILKKLDIIAPFKSASVDGEKNLLYALEALEKQVWGCHAHYMRGLGRVVFGKQKKIRIKFYNVAKYFMFLPDANTIFDRLTAVASNKCERQLINHINREYIRLGYFNYSQGFKQSRELAGRITTSPLEGLNGALKQYLKIEKSAISIVKFISEKSRNPLKKAKDVSIYQMINYDNVIEDLKALEAEMHDQGSQQLITKYVKRAKPIEAWRKRKQLAEKRQKMLTDHYDSKKTIEANIKANKKIQKLAQSKLYSDKYQLLRVLGETKRAVYYKKINESVLARGYEEEAEDVSIKLIDYILGMNS